MVDRNLMIDLFCKQLLNNVEKMPNKNLRLSNKAKELLQSIEVLRLYPYDDKNGNRIFSWCANATIGYGHLILKNEWPKFKNGISEAQADDTFDNDLLPAENFIKSHVTAELSQQQYDALVIFVFNIGVGQFASSSALKMINNSNAITNYDTLEKAWKAFCKQRNGGVLVKLDGLVNRRAAEWNIWYKGIYERW